MSETTCTQCRQQKPPTDFQRRTFPNLRSGTQRPTIAVCKRCMSERQQAGKREARRGSGGQSGSA